MLTLQIVLVLVRSGDGVSGYTWVQPSRVCTANRNVEEVVRCRTMCMPSTTRARYNDTTLCKCVALRIEKSLGGELRLSVGNTATTNRTVERGMRKVIHVAKPMHNMGRKLVSE